MNRRVAESALFGGGTVLGTLIYSFVVNDELDWWRALFVGCFVGCFVGVASYVRDYRARARVKLDE